MTEPVRIRLLVLDVDGVITDGTILLFSSGEEVRSVHFHDLDAVARLRRRGVDIAIVSGEYSPSGHRVAERFGIGDAGMGGDKDKLAALARTDPAGTVGYRDARDVLRGRRRPGRARPRRRRYRSSHRSDATAPARAAADHVLDAAGGHGAVAAAVTMLEQTKTATCPTKEPLGDDAHRSRTTPADPRRAVSSGSLSHRWADPRVPDGKVGSTAVYRALEALALPSRSSMRTCSRTSMPSSARSAVRMQSPRQRCRHLARGRRLREEFDTRAAIDGTSSQWSVIPVIRNVSACFESLHELVPGARTGGASVSELGRTFLDTFSHDAPLTWFQKQLTPVFGIDPYSTPFPHEDGFSDPGRRSSKAVDHPPRRLSVCLLERAGCIFGIKVRRLPRANQSDAKWYGSLFGSSPPRSRSLSSTWTPCTARSMRGTSTRLRIDQIRNSLQPGRLALASRPTRMPARAIRRLLKEGNLG